MTAVAPSLAIEERERSAAAPQCHTKHGKAIRGEETGREGASHGERRSTAMAVAEKGATELTLTYARTTKIVRVRKNRRRGGGLGVADRREMK
jgi:hypothetical protein